MALGHKLQHGGPLHLAPSRHCPCCSAHRKRKGDGRTSTFPLPPAPPPAPPEAHVSTLRKPAVAAPPRGRDVCAPYAMRVCPHAAGVRVIRL